ncbi:MAG: (2Fe-2S)-binding protein [Polyangiaceae bacterium]|jgi:ferredoxin|nr:(2Fe-2S)-binding protein [Polyangiaceae bacterium]
MPKVTYQGRTMDCERGEVIRDVLARNGASAHNTLSRAINCHGLGTCGTCAVQVQGEVSPPGLIERLRLMLWPHTPGSGLRLACKARVHDDINVVKHRGFWGQRVQ